MEGPASIFILGNERRVHSWQSAIFDLDFVHGHSQYLMADEQRERDISDMTVRIDRTLCIGSGNCTNIAPEVFVIGADNIVAFQDDAPDINQGRLEEATAICPVDALILEDETGEQIVP